jgi:hypothetical protein
LVCGFFQAHLLVHGIREHEYPRQEREQQKSHHQGRLHKGLPLVAAAKQGKKPAAGEPGFAADASRRRAMPAPPRRHLSVLNALYFHRQFPASLLPLLFIFTSSL